MQLRIMINMMIRLMMIARMMVKNRITSIMMRQIRERITPLIIR